jgi:glycosyltransferase involved in cell wall biosynthesis
MAAMEAQAAGCLPVVAATGALPETVRGGCVLDPNDHDAFVANCVSILEKGADLDAARADMAKTALLNFDISSLATEWLAAFEKINEPERTDRTLRAEVGV